MGKAGKYLAAALLLSIAYWFANQLTDSKSLYFPYAVIEKIPYSMDKRLTADWYIPQKEGPWPVLVLVHGGGFVEGSAQDSHIVHLARHFAGRGWVCASIEYRLGYRDSIEPRHFLRATIEAVQDLRTFLRYLKYTVHHGNPWQIDTNRIIVFGHSAGAVIVYHAIFYQGIEDFQGLWLSDSTLKAFGDLEGTEYRGHTSTFWIGIASSGGVFHPRYIRKGRAEHLVIMHPPSEGVIPYLMRREPSGLQWYGGGYIDSVLRQQGESVFSLYPDFSVCRFIECHDIIGSHKYTGIGTLLLEEYLDKILPYLSEGKLPPPSLRKREARYFFSWRRCLKHIFLRDRSIYGDCTAIMGELYSVIWWYFTVVYRAIFA